MKSILALGALALSMFTSASPARADHMVFGGSDANSVTLAVSTSEGTVNIPVYLSGWYTNTGSHNSGNPNYIAANFGTTTFRDFFTFDLSSLDVTVQSASLILNNYDIISSPLYTLYDVGTPGSILDATNNGAVNIFDDLGSGLVYGSHQYDVSEAGQFSTIGLNAAAVAAINSHEGSSFSLGGSTVDGADVAVAPEPSTFLLTAPVLAGLGFIRRRFRSA